MDNEAIKIRDRQQHEATLTAQQQLKNIREKEEEDKEKKRLARLSTHNSTRSSTNSNYSQDTRNNFETSVSTEHLRRNNPWLYSR